MLHMQIDLHQEKVSPKELCSREGLRSVVRSSRTLAKIQFTPPLSERTTLFNHKARRKGQDFLLISQTNQV